MQLNRYAAAILAFGLACAAPLFSQDSPHTGASVRGLPKPKAATSLKRYGKAIALVVGVNYTEREGDVERIHLPALRNAQRDAQAVHDVLTELYGFEVKLLLGPQATRQALAQALEELSSPVRQIGPDDAVLVYFSGHGARVDDVEERGVIYPFDVVIQQGQPVGNMLRLHSDLINVLKNCPARHKLIVLDSCHSGEIFNRFARPFSEPATDNADLLGEPTLQAIASCRGSQVASDGLRGENSPFTAALIRALQRVPACELGNEKSPIPASRLFVSMRADLKSLRTGQSPDCRRLVNGDGEFLFWPAATANFDRFRNTPEDFELLQAMVPGEYGKWWFDETPWFIPSLRRMILEGKSRDEVARTTAQSLAIRQETLQKLADLAVTEMEKVNDSLTQMRVRHYRRLLAPDDLGKFRVEAAKIAAELQQQLALPATGAGLEAPDVHLLAVLQHFLFMSETKDASLAAPVEDRAGAVVKTYTQALEMYQAADNAEPALAALCHCDLGNFLLDNKRDWTRAAREFEAALEPFSKDAALALAETEMMSSDPVSAADRGARTTKEAPAAFQIYVFCREADAWQRQNRWGEADRCLDNALAVAQNFAPDHNLTAFVQTRVAWSSMEQWQISRATQAFRASNRILANLAREGAGDQTADRRPELADPASSLDPDTFANLLKYDYDAVINYLHNLHGLAMAQRFEGHVAQSAATYRLITEKLSQALRRLAVLRSATNAELSADVELRLAERLINTQERLGDCNLFGDPELRDIKEAADDYRRALALCGDIPLERRRERQASLLFRQALALAVPSSVQDVELAHSLCDEAEALLVLDPGQKSGVTESLRSICPAAVNVFEARQADEKCTERLNCLRKAIGDIGAQHGRSLHRDQLELLLFAAKILVDEADKSQRFQTAKDADFLLALCRQTLLRGDGGGDAVALAEENRISRGESSRYLRPYYDAVMRTKLVLAPKHVKELLEVQWEATQGQLFLKPPSARPVLALYVLDGKGYLLLDVPRGISKHVALESYCTANDLKLACHGTVKPLSLPPDIFKELAALPIQEYPGTTSTARNGVALIECWWCDPVRGLEVEKSAPLDSNQVSSERTTAAKPVVGVFPFALPGSVSQAAP